MRVLCLPGLCGKSDPLNWVTVFPHPQQGLSVCMCGCVCVLFFPHQNYLEDSLKKKKQNSDQIEPSNNRTIQGLGSVNVKV